MAPHDVHISVFNVHTVNKLLANHSQRPFIALPSACINLLDNGAKIKRTANSEASTSSY